MQTRLITSSQPDSLAIVISILRQGGLVAFPTDTVYGLAADPFNAGAVERLFFAKERQQQKAIAVLVGSVDQVSRVSSQVSPAAEKLMNHFWPGALTIIARKHPDVPSNLSPDETVGVRMPDHPVALRLLREFGPLATTSANLSGGLNPVSAIEVMEQLNGRIECILDGGICPGGVPSTVVRIEGEKAVILRHGAISVAQIQGALGIS